MNIVFIAISQVILALAMPYFFISLLLGVRASRRASGGKLSNQENLEFLVGSADSAGSENDMVTYFIVPCLNEEQVIGATVHYLLSETNGQVVVVDDGSDDQTGKVAHDAALKLSALERLTVVRRELPNARAGKGAALNAGFQAVLSKVSESNIDRGSVIVGVMDADGRMSKSGLSAALRGFKDERIGAVQLIVRIRNRKKLITRFQDVEFWMISAMSQFARTVSGTVSLGGNAQFTRLIALDTLGGDPWSDSLTEDLDLGIRLIEQGWRITTVGDAFVDQQAVEHYGQLLRQRTRWYQGHMMSIRRLPALWKSGNVSQTALLEVTAYLLVPWVIVLPWSILQQWVLYELIFGNGQGIFAQGLTSIPWQVGYAVMWYILSFLPNIVVGVTYAKRTKSVSLPYALLLGHLMVIYNFVGYISAWRAVGRMIIGKGGWAKTARSDELAVDEDLATDSVVA